MGGVENPSKGIENLLESCKIRSDRSDLNWSLTIAGTGEPSYMESLRVRINDLNLEKKVHMIGEVGSDKKKACFTQSDVLVLPSHTENFGIVIAEALAHGVPVIAGKGTPWKRVEKNKRP